MDVTITDPKVTRYFMSRNEAAELVLVAAALKESGTFIQEMGSQVAIVEIVTRMANHLGKKPSIVFTGLSQGEKLHEELFDGPSIKTKYPQILQSKHEIRTGLVKDIESSIPESNLSARVLIERLYQTYIA
jgi:FlaA1/EpsC-like NDP-sugar epimerase